MQPSGSTGRTDPSGMLSVQTIAPSNRDVRSSYLSPMPHTLISSANGISFPGTVMTALMEFTTESGATVTVEVDRHTQGAQLVALGDDNTLARAGRTFDSALTGIRSAAESALAVFRDGALKPDGVELEFGVKITAEAKRGDRQERGRGASDGQAVLVPRRDTGGARYSAGTCGSGGSDRSGALARGARTCARTRARAVGAAQSPDSSSRFSGSGFSGSGFSSSLSRLGWSLDFTSSGGRNFDQRSGNSEGM